MAEACAGWENRDGYPEDCQFEDEADEYHYDGESYCRFHMPMGVPGTGGKADWEDNEKKAISNTIIGRIRDEMARSKNERGMLDFSGVVVPQVLNMEGESIWLVDFTRAQFYSLVRFDRAQFLKIALFTAAQFHGIVRFDSAHFYEDGGFETTKFHRQVTFAETRFNQGVWFDGSQFRGTAEFRCTRFDGVASYDRVHFYSNANFTGRTDPEPPELRQFHELEFHGARFGSGADFSNREFQARTDFGSCVFARAPRFHGSSLHQDTSFGGIHCFPDVTSEGADSAYRTLRLAMEEQRARDEEGIFYAQERKARRNLKMARFSPEYLISLGYDLGSNYGLSVARPLAWFLGGIIASAFLLLNIGVFNGAGADLAAMWSDAVYFSARQTFLLFDALRADAGALTKYAFNIGGTSGWLRAWGVVLSLFEALALLLLILAVRWRYRR